MPTTGASLPQGEYSTSLPGGLETLTPSHARRTLCALLSVALLAVPGVANAADWAQFHGSDVTKVGVQTAEALITPQTVTGLHVVWSAATGASADGINSSPTVVGGVVYIGSDDGSVWAFDQRNGATLWSFATGGPVNSAPALDGGRVIFGSNDGSVYAVDAAAGTLVWTHALGGKISASPLIVGGIVYVGSRGGSFVALRAATGETVWQTKPWAVWQSASYDDGTVFVGSDQAKVFAYDAATGALRWAAGAGARVRCTPSVSGGIVYVGTDAGKVLAFKERTGIRLWRRAAAASATTPVVRSAPAVDAGTVFVTTGESTPMDGHTVAFDALTGAKRWTAHMADYSTSSPAVANGIVFVGSYDHRIYAFDGSTGALLWAPPWPALPRGVNSSPAIVDGEVIVGCRDGSVYAFGL